MSQRPVRTGGPAYHFYLLWKRRMSLALKAMPIHTRLKISARKYGAS